MGSRYRALAGYSALLAAAAIAWLFFELQGAPALPPLWAAATALIANLLVWRFGLNTGVGLISMERVPQIALLLAFSAPAAAVVCATASFIWPFLSRSYNQGSMKVAAIRGVHNAAMTMLMLLAAGAAYAYFGGRLPLDDFELRDIGPIIAAALAAQVVNIGLMTLFFRLDGRQVRSVVTPAYALSDLVFVPAGVLCAILYSANAQSLLALFALVMMVFVLSFNSIGDAASKRAPLTQLFGSEPLHGAQSLEALGERILKEARTRFHFDEFYFVLVERGQQMLDLRVHERRGERLPARTKSVKSGLFGWVVEQSRPVLIEHFARAPQELRERAESTGKETGSLLIAPLLEHGVVAGLISVQHTKAGVYSEADLHLMEQLAARAAPAVADARAFEELERLRKSLESEVTERTHELEKANDEKGKLIELLREKSVKLERESQEDALTGLANRRRFNERLAAEIEMALAVGQPLTVAIADLDHFKSINDRLGHLIGDRALKEIATLMRGACRPSDLVARIGGEEFALVLPGMKRDDGVEFCERLRDAVEQHGWNQVHPDLNVTLSIGLAQWDGGAEVEELVRAADQKMYRAKSAGRNQVAA